MSDIKAITMPKFGMTMEEGTVDSWIVNEGDTFHQGDALVTIESSKLSNDLEAPFSGTLRKIVAEAGAELPVGSLIGVAADPSVPDAEIEQFIASQSS